MMTQFPYDLWYSYNDTILLGLTEAESRFCYWSNENGDKKGSINIWSIKKEMKRLGIEDMIYIAT